MNPSDIYIYIWNVTGMSAVILSSILMFRDITNFKLISDFVYSNIFVFNLYKIATTLIICFAVIYLSVSLQKSKILTFIGRNSISMMGLEFITHSYLALSLLPMINLGIPKVISTVDVITLEVFHFGLNYLIIKSMVFHFPALMGKTEFFIRKGGISDECFEKDKRKVFFE